MALDGGEALYSVADLSARLDGQIRELPLQR